METLDFSGDFSIENAKLEGIANRVNKHVGIISGYLDKLRTAWQDSDSENYISNWKACCDEITSMINNTVTNAENDLDSIANFLNN